MSHQVQKRLLFDWHVPGFLDEVRLDVPAYLAAVDRIRPDTLLLMAKSAFGCTYYDDAFGYHNAALHQDLFADLVGPLHARGVEVVAYYNITLNDVVAAEHPEWHQVDPDGSPVIKFDYHQLCMNSPYRDLIIAMMADLAGKYPIDGLWFDITYVHEPGCFCAYCREEYARETGQDLTPEVGAEPAANARFQAFRRDLRRRFLEDAVARLRQVRPGLRFGWNHAGDPLFSESEADRSADWHSMEFHPPFFARGGVNARVMRALGKPRELMLPESLGSWGDWTVQAPQTMRTMVAIAAAQGASPTVGHVAFPTGDLGGQVADGVVETIATAFRLLEERRPWCIDAESVPVGAVLHSEEDFRAQQAAGGLQRLPRGASTLYGAAELLGDCAIPYDILSERMLGRLGAYEFLVVPEVGYISDQAGEALRQYVREGGCLLASGPTSLTDALGQVRGFSLQDLLGVEYVEVSPYSLNYVEVSSPQLAEGLPRMPILAKAGPSSPHVAPVRPSLRVRAAAGAAVLGTLVDPALESDYSRGYHIYHGHAPAAYRTSWPAVLHYRYGRGQVVYLSIPLGAAYGATHSPWLRRLAANALAIMGLPHRARLDCPPGVEVALLRQSGRWVLHLVPRLAETPESTQVAEGLAIAGVRVFLERAETKKVRLAPSGESLPFRRQEGGIVFEVPAFTEWTTVVIE